MAEISARRIRDNEQFSSFKEFSDCLTAYEKENCVIFKRTSTKTVEKYNAGLKPGQTKLNECLYIKYCTIYCIHGGPVRPSTSTGQRPCQRTLNLKCPAMMSLKAVAYPKQRLVISDFKSLHQNHPVKNKNFSQHYSKNKKLDSATKELVNTMFKCRGKPADIVQQVRDTTGLAINSKDLANLKQRFMSDQRGGRTSEDDLLVTLDKMVKNDPGSQYVIGHVEPEPEEELEENEDGTPKPSKPKLVDFIFFQTSAMRKNLEQFPEIIGMDTTYELNKHNMHLSVMLVIDNHKNGRIVGYVFLRRETNDILEAALKVFVQKNPDVPQTVKTVIVDKDYKEISGVNKVLPNVHVHLCHTHVKRIFARKVQGEENSKKLTTILDKMCVSESAEKFEEHYKELTSVASDQFRNYFDKYWRNIPSAWVLYVRNESLSLGVRSTNHVESHNGKIKRVVSRTSTLADCVRELLRLHTSREFESSYRDFVEMAKRSYLANSRDPNVQVVLNTVSDWGAVLLVSELKKSYDLSEDILQDADECNCQFSKMFGIGLCQHVFYHRQQSGEDIIKKDLPPRWLNRSLASSSNDRSLSQVPNASSSNDRSLSQVPNGGTATSVMRVTPLGPKPMDKNKKYRTALKLCSDISSILSLHGNLVFEKRMQELEKILQYWMSGKEIIVLPVNPNGTVDCKLNFFMEL
ncbi:hypothetical protein FOCC_FOCC016476 [Frankliniella occidentalis]|nr:hypothetical protein FOCC_FOCC016476 [Frankliniella occidentalis]